MTSNSDAARIIIQQCTSGRLQLNANNASEAPCFASISRGIVVYVCFFKTADETTVDKIAQSICSVKLSRSLDDESKLVSIADLPGSILVVPQATLGGKMKAKRMQYHSNISKEIGEVLFGSLIKKLKSLMPANEACKVCFGTYGNLQVLNIETNGPYTHLINFQ